MTEQLTRPSAADRIKAACWFAERGFGVFSVWSTDRLGSCRCPKGKDCDNAGKHPIGSQGFKENTRDPAKIRVLLSAASDPNYGLVCPEGVFALDVDGDGLSQLEQLEAELGALPPTLRTKTAHGQHIFLRWPDDLPQPMRKMFGYVTRWGSGAQAGYVIGPRSVHQSGAVYAPDAEAGFEIAEIPRPWAETALAGEREPTFRIAGAVLPEPGGRHDWLRDRARYYRGVIDSPPVLRAALLAENQRLPVPKTETEVDRAIGEVFQKFPLDPPAATEERAARRLGEDELDLLGAPNSGQFPLPPDPAAFRGLLGECCEDLAGGTDASLVGLLGSLIAFAGAMIPGHAYFHRVQTSSPFIALVGESSIGRKGTAMTRAGDAFSEALERTAVDRVVMDGLNSGEGLVSELYYRREHFPHEPSVGLVFEEEYATLLASRGREGSTLDPKMRQAFDGGPISNRRSGERKTVVGPYWLPALIGITPVELRVRLEPAAMQSGSANRWLYLPVQRRDVIPTNDLPQFQPENRARLQEAHRAAQKRPPLLLVDASVTERLAQYADFLPQIAFGVARDLTRRMSIIAFRVALVHALVEQSVRVTLEHLERALALTEYARRGLAWVFGDTIGNPDADLLFRHLQAAGRLTRRAITQQIIRDPIRRQAAIDELLRLGRARVEAVHTTGRARVDLVPGRDEGAFVPFVPSMQGASVPLVQGLSNRTSENTETVEYLHTSEWDAAQKPHRSSTEGAQKHTEVSTPPDLHESRTEGLHTSRTEGVIGTRPDGQVWCHDVADHYASHRDVNSQPWCEICRPGGAA